MAHTLLLADDSLTIHRVIELTFAGTDMNVVVVRDGQQAVDRLAEMRPDIVLADIAMPKLDGYEVAGFVARTPSLAGVPVLLLSGAFEPVDEARVKASGAAGVLVKPFEPSLVISRVKELLGLAARESKPALGRLVTSTDTPVRESQTPSRPAPPPPKPAPPRVTAAPTADDAWETLRAESGLGPDSVESPGGANGGDLDLDAAFATLDARLAGRSAPRGRATHAPPAPRLPAALDPARHRPDADAGADKSGDFAVEDGWFATPASPAAAAEAEVVDRFEGLVEDPFEGDLADVIANPEPVAAPPAPGPPAAAAPPAAPWAPAPPPIEPAGPHVSPPAPFAAEPPAAVAPPGAVPAPPAGDVTGAEAPRPWGATYAGPPQVADAFAAMLANEQGEGVAASATGEITDDIVRAVAAQVAGRIDHQMLASAIRAAVGDVVERVVRETVTGIAEATIRLEAAERVERLARAEVDRVAAEAVRLRVNEVAERLVASEISRIRAAARQRPSGS